MSTELPGPPDDRADGAISLRPVPPVPRRRRRSPGGVGHGFLTVALFVILACIAVALWDSVTFLHGLAGPVGAGAGRGPGPSVVAAEAHRLAAVRSAWQAVGAAFAHFARALGGLFA